MTTNYKYSLLPKRGQRVLIIDGFEDTIFKGRTGVIVPGKKRMGNTYKMVHVVGLGVRRFYFKYLYRIDL